MGGMIWRYTFVCSRGCSVVDYVLSSQDLFKCIIHLEVQEPNILTDHCLISFLFDFFTEETSISRSEEYEQVNNKYTWKTDFKMIMMKHFAKLIHWND